MRDLWLSPAARLARDRVVYDKGVAIFPNMISDDPDVMRTMEKLADELSAVSTSAVDQWGVVDHDGLTGDFLNLRNVAGRPMIESNYPPANNAKLREGLGLSGSFVSARHERIFKEVHALMFDRTAWDPRPARIARISSTCIPFFTKDVEFKIKMANHLFQNLDDVINLWAKGSLQDLYDKHRFVAAYYLVSRLQPDRITLKDGVFSSKDRDYNDLQYAASSGARGTRGVADKSLVINGSVFPGHFRVRRRTAYGMSAMANYVWLAVIDPFRAAYTSKFAATWKHRGITDMNRKLAGFSFAFGTDVKQYDQTVPSFMIDAFVNWMPVKDVLKPLLRDLMSAPYFAPPQNVGDEGPGSWLGNPLEKKDFRLQMGLPSGISPNSDFGKWSNTSAYLCALDDVGARVIERGIESILCHLDPDIALLNMGDDNIALFSEGSKEIATEWHSKLKKEELISPYFKHELEAPVSFGGALLTRSQYGGLTLVPNLKSFAINWFVPERGIGTRMREAWFIGWLERARYFMDAPRFNAVKEIVDRRLQDDLGFLPDVIARQEEAKWRLPIVAATPEDVAVLINPDTLHYRYDSGDISPEVERMFSANIPIELITKMERFME